MYSEETINQTIQPKSLALTVTIAIAWRFVIIFWAKTILSWINTVIINNMVLVLDFSLWLIHVVLLTVWDCLNKLFPSLSFSLSLSLSFLLFSSIHSMWIMMVRHYCSIIPNVLKCCYYQTNKYMYLKKR